MKFSLVLGLAFSLLVILNSAEGASKTVFGNIIKEYDGAGISHMPANTVPKGALQHWAVYYSGNGLDCWFSLVETATEITWKTPGSDDHNCKIHDRWTSAVSDLTDILFVKAIGSSPDLQKVKAFMSDLLKDEKRGRSVKDKSFSAGKFALTISVSPEAVEGSTAVDVALIFSVKK